MLLLIVRIGSYLKKQQNNFQIMDQVKLFLQSAVASYKSGDLNGAESACQKVLEYNPTIGDAYNILGLIHQQKSDLKLALEYSRKALQCDKHNVVYLNNIAKNLSALDKADEAIKMLQKAIQIQPAFFNSYFNLGKIFKKMGMFEEAENSFLKSLELKQDYAPALNNLGNIYQVQGKTDEAIALYQQGLLVNASLPELNVNIGNAYLSKQEIQKATDAFLQAIQNNVNHWPAYMALANIYLAKNDYAEAEIRLKQVLKLNPENKEAWLNLGSLHRKSGEYGKAITCFTQLKNIDPANIQANINLGVTYITISDDAQAKKCFEEVLKSNPDNQEALFGLGKLFEQGKEYAHAQELYEKCISLSPDYKAQVIYELMLLKLRCADWKQYDDLFKQLLEETHSYLSSSKQTQSITPLSLNYLPIEMEIHSKVAAKYAQLMSTEMSEIKKRCNFSHVKTLHKGKLRVGYISPDFRLHAVGLLLNQLFQHHDKDKFEVYAYSIVNTDDFYNKSFREGADVFRDISLLSHEAAAKCINEDEIQILIDLAGYTTYCRPQILALQPAPIQVAFLGYPDTTGADYMQYILADEWLIPKSLQKFYKEEVIYLPHAFLSSPLDISDKKMSKTELGLPENSFVFCCFNSIYKISPEVFVLWMDILRQAPEAVLWLSKENESAVLNLHEEAKKAGIDPARIIFAPRLPQDEYLASYQHADLFLDTLNYSAGSTAVCALYSGVPMITFAGTTNAARMGASITAAANLEDFICVRREDYITKAIYYYQNRTVLNNYKKHLKNSKSELPLFNMSQRVQNIEQQLMYMWNK